MDADRETLRKAFSSPEADERVRKTLGKIDSEIEEARRLPANEIVMDSIAMRLAGIRNKVDRALAMENELTATRLETRLDEIKDSITPELKAEIDKEIRRLRKF